MRESTIEQHAVAMFKAQGDLPYKFTSPGRRNVPDRLRLREIPPAHQAIVAHYVQFIEFKATGEKPTAAQEREHARLRKLGYRVEVIDSMAGVDALVSGAAPAAPGASTAGNQQPARDWELTCHECDGSGHVYVKHQVAERKTDIQEFKEECECCEGRGFVFAFQDIPGIEEYVKACRTASSAPGVSTVEDAGAQKEAVMDAIADALGEAYDCTRVWHAWSYGTMGPDDFALVAADPSRVAEIATAAIAAMRPAPAAGDAIRDLIAKHAELLDKSDHTYFELARTRQTGWMAWLCSHPAETHPDRKVLARGQGETPDEACREALADFEMRAAIAAQRKGDA